MHVVYIIILNLFTNIFNHTFANTFTNTFTKRTTCTNEQLHAYLRHDDPLRCRRTAKKRTIRTAPVEQTRSNRMFARVFVHMFLKVIVKRFVTVFW